VLFIDLRDTRGITQCVSAPTEQAHAVAEGLRSEWVVKITGTVRHRLEGTENADLATGAIEVAIEHIEVLGRVDGSLPIPVFGEAEYPEDMRLRYRFLDMRRPALQRSLRLRAEVVQYLRQRMIDLGFLEVWTPILTASSPEGARDFLVPSRLHPGKFYALPQAPQQFKQLLMVGGFEGYFQIAPCFRDEAARADRSPGEFYQLDIEMAFVEQEDVFQIVEPILRDTFRRFGNGAEVDEMFPRIPYDESMLRYGNDKPDLRNPLEIADLTDILSAPEMTFGPFREILDKGGVARAIVIPPPEGKSRAWFKSLEAWAVEQGAKGLGYLVGGKREISGGPLAKFFEGPVGDAIANRLNDQYDPYTLSGGGIAFLVVADPAFATKFAGLLRTKLGEELGLIEQNAFRFCWITDFPMFEKDEHGKIGFSHNPFSMPQGGLDALDTQDPLTIKAFQYDIVCNGIELSSGAIRNHRVEIMQRAFEIAGYGLDELEVRFGGMLNAFRCGAPPHGGIAPGVDRIVMMLNGSSNLREVVAFPMNQGAQDLLMGAPSEVTPEQWAELHIRPMPRKV
jgi:aspartyl-tRNA synthetase